jgi:hypothetical protein
MIWGMSTSTFTLVHVVLSLMGILAGLVVMFGPVAGKPNPVMLVATVVARVA